MAGLLDIFGSSGGDTLGLLGMSAADVQRARDDAQAQSLYALAGRLFQGGNTGQSIAEGMQLGQQAYKDAMKGDIADRMQSFQLQDVLRKRKEEEASRASQAQVRALAQASYQPGGQTTISGRPWGVVGDDEGNLMPGAGVTQPGIDMPSLMRKLEAIGSPEAFAYMKNVTEARKGMQPTLTSLAEGATLQATDPYTGLTSQVAAGLPKEKTTPAEIQGYNLAVQQGYKGNFFDYQAALKKAGAASQTVNVADKSFLSGFGGTGADIIKDSRKQALGAQDTLQQIGTLKPLIAGDNVFSGGLASSQVAVTRLADALNIPTGKWGDRLNNTTTAMQQLAKAELTTASSMEGQGTITDFERGLISRASGGNLMTMTAGEVSALLVAMEKTAKIRLGTHERNMKWMRQNPETAKMSGLYELPSTVPVGIGGGATIEQLRAEAARRLGGK